MAKNWRLRHGQYAASRSVLERASTHIIGLPILPKTRSQFTMSPSSPPYVPFQPPKRNCFFTWGSLSSFIMFENGAKRCCVR